MPIKNPQVIGALPEAPNPADRSTFNSRAYPWSAALDPWTTQVNQLAGDLYANTEWAQQKAEESQVSAEASGDSAVAAELSKDAAQAAELAAGASKNAAQNSEGEAAISAAQALSAREASELAQSASEYAAAESAQSAAEAAQAAAVNIAAVTHGSDDKNPPTDADEIPAVDSESGWTLKKLTIGNLKAYIFAAFKVVVTELNAKETLGLGTASTKDAGMSIGQLAPAENVIRELKNAGVIAVPESEYSYNPLGQMFKITDENGDTMIAYNADGAVNTITYQTGRVETYSYNPDGGISGMTATGGEL